MNTVKYLVSLIVLLVTARSCPGASDLVVFLSVVAITLVYLLIRPYESYHLGIRKRDMNGIGSNSNSTVQNNK